jgi:hypothetical protein
MSANFTKNSWLVCLGYRRRRSVAQSGGTDTAHRELPTRHPDVAGRPVMPDGMGIAGDRSHSSDQWADLDSTPPRLYPTVRTIDAISAARQATSSPYRKNALGVSPNWRLNIVANALGLS